MTKMPVAITGMASMSAAGIDNDTIWENLITANRCLSDASLLHKDALPYPFFATPIFSSNRHDSALNTLHLARLVAESAIKEANIDVSANTTGIVLGTTAGSALHFIETYAYKRALRNEQCSNEIFSNGNNKEPHDADDYFKANLALNLGQALQIKGPALTIANACTSGADAIGLGMELLLQNECDYVICGGADVLSLVPHTGFARLMVYDENPCRPFDVNRAGLNLGEGAAVFVLEKVENALRRKAPIIGLICGYGSGSDAHHFTAPHPEARGLLHAFNCALDESGVEPSQLAFVNAHGTATKENDKIEGRFFHTHLPNLPVWASKGMTGHTLGAAGALEAAFSILSLQRGIIPSSAGFMEIDPDILISPTTSNIEISKKHALSTSLGFGGGNAALIVSTDTSAFI